MTIVATEVESIHGASDQKRMIFFKCQDHLGAWHPYGPVITDDPNFDADAFKSVAAEKVSIALANAEFNQMIGE